VGFFVDIGAEPPPGPNVATRRASEETRLALILRR
jgi:hypothetical protein